MQPPGKLNSDEKRNYAFGVVLGRQHGMATVSHGGSWAGYRSSMIWVPEKRFAAAILANTSNMDTWGLALKITGLYLGVPPAPSTPASARPPAAVKADPVAWEP